MVAEPWILKMGSQVSTNLKQTFLLQTSKRKSLRNSSEHSDKKNNKQTIGILSFEVANVMSKTVYLYKSLTESEISKLKNEILKCEGVQNLVSSDESYLLELALAERLDDLNRVAAVVSRLGKRCTEPALQGFEHVYSDIMSGVIEVKELGFLVKDMEAMARKMERYVNATARLYSEMEVLNELERAMKKFQHNQHEESKRAFEQKFMWQKQDVRHLRDISLWNQTYDKVVELLARTVCTVYARICSVFGDSCLSFEASSQSPNKDEGIQVSSQLDRRRHSPAAAVPPLPPRRVLSKKNSGVMLKKGLSFKSQADSRRSELAMFQPEDIVFPCGTSPGRLFMECLSLSSSVSKFDDDDDYYDGCGGDYDDRGSQISTCRSGILTNGSRREQRNNSSCFSSSLISMDHQRQSNSMNGARFGPKSRLVCYAPPSTVGGSALALHYANVIIVIEKLLRYPHLVGEEARDDLYQMLPTSLRLSLRTNLKSYMKNFAIYDAPLAHDWKETLDGLLKWLAPLAHNMIRWQSERNFEQQQIVTRTNVLLLQTLYFADREKTEAAICKLLLGLNYICRYEHQQNALLDCASSFDFEDCMEWQLQCRAAAYAD
ncbi:protein PSK SIMULATOR 1 [Cannabis sativa]|uniref:protein PSK SIMULATOR 1 n=1 Tax=Cannabis sativa TaxID=3483 RepID=UPI0029CA07A5|nr:protein PSK SIMULATOR 1 [Cannabis sativa]